jgi:hypothetical protein
MTEGWFGTVDLREASRAGRRAVAALARLLDQLRPTRLERDRSRAGVNNHETSILLAHQSEPMADIEIVVAELGWTNVYGPHGHEEVYGVGADSDEWETEFVDIMAEILQGQYEIKVGGWRSPRRQVDYGCQYAHPAHEAKEQ